jgi:hypothetical protein
VAKHELDTALAYFSAITPNTAASSNSAAMAKKRTANDLSIFVGDVIMMGGSFSLPMSYVCGQTRRVSTPEFSVVLWISSVFIAFLAAGSIFYAISSDS